MKINDIKLGHATNSSSRHDIIIIKDKKPKLSLPKLSLPKDGGYFFEEFVLTTPKTKMEYLATQFSCHLTDFVGRNTANMILDHIFGLFTFGDSDQCLDHQSQIAFPYKISNNQVLDIDYEFLKDLTEFIRRDDVIIVGGSDQMEENHGAGLVRPTLGEYETVLPREIFDICNTKLFSKKDGDWWVLYNSATGAKATFSFNENAAPLVKSRTPELVDLKITDYCEVGCPYCYQNSSIQGKHCDLNDFYSILVTLVEMSVFEVAIGGGDPIKHPDLVFIMEELKKHGITPNLSTASFDWLLEENASKILSIAGRVGFSIDSLSKFNQFNQNWNACRKPDKPNGVEPSIHLVAGVMNKKELETFLHENEYDIVALGYKSVGRGKNLQPKMSNKEFLEILLKSQESHCLDFSIDTCLAQEKEVLEKYDIPHILYGTHEGAKSCYIDLVTKICGPFSYCTDKDRFFEFKYGKDFEEKFQKHWRTW